MNGDILKLGFSHSSVGKESSCNAGDPGSIPGLGRYPRERKGKKKKKRKCWKILKYSGPENSMDYIVIGKESDMTEKLSLSLYCTYIKKHDFFVDGYIP